MKYPTKEEILENPPMLIAKDIKILIEWKDGNYQSWSKKSINTKWAALETLVESLSKQYNKKSKVKIAKEPMYDPRTQTIFLSETKPSIISTLHEFGHHIYGESELKACAYSVWMFKIVFPKVYNKMKWDKHLLKI